MIKTAAAQTSGKSGRALAPVLMTLITNANKKGIRFSPDEISLILELIKEGKTQKEKEQIDRTIQMVMSMLKNRIPKIPHSACLNEDTSQARVLV